MASGNWLSSLGSQRIQLKKVTTVVKKADGSCFVETILPDGSVKLVPSGQGEALSFLQDAEAGYSQLHLHQFDPIEGKWITLPSPEPEPQPSVAEGKLCVVSYNVWFSETNQLIRAKSMMDLIEPFQPDVIAFQEVTLPFLQVVKEQPWIQERYWLSDTTGSTCHPYGIMMLINRHSPWLPRPKLSIHQLPSSMGRRFLRCISENGISIATAHLESESNCDVRVLQLGKIFDSLNAVPNSSLSIFLGDTNFGDNTPESALLSEKFPQYQDLWLQLNPDVDPQETHTMVDPSDPARRIDKLFYAISRSPHSLISLDSEPHFQFIGTEPIQPANIHVSDILACFHHFN